MVLTSISDDKFTLIGIRRHKIKAMKFLEGISKQNPYLFAHWRAGMVGGFA